MSDLRDIIRPLRNSLLNASDKYMSIPDFPMTTEQKLYLIQYRQMLRDLPSSVNVNDYNSETIHNCFPMRPNYINLSPF